MVTGNIRKSIFYHYAMATSSFSCVQVRIKIPKLLKKLITTIINGWKLTNPQRAVQNSAVSDWMCSVELKTPKHRDTCCSSCKSPLLFSDFNQAWVMLTNVVYLHNFKCHEKLFNSCQLVSCTEMVQRLWKNRHKGICHYNKSARKKTHFMRVVCKK